MTIAERMKQRLSQVGIYAPGAQALGWELNAYAAALEQLYARLNVLFRERFIVTAQAEGLAAYEQLFGPVRSDESAQSRREKLLLRLNLGDGDFTPAGIAKAMVSFGLSYSLREFPALGKLNIDADTDYDAAQQAWIRREVEKIIPAHIEFQLTFNSMSWADLDALNRTFGAIDAENQTWSEIDSRVHQ